MTTELPKTYDPSAVETEAYRVWLAEKAFHPDPAAPGEPYCIVIPPPNVTGALHLGHAMNNTLQDILVRKARMEGKNALWIPGLDHAGIATQAVVEKQLKEKENKTRHDVGREGLVERIWQWKQQYGDRILSQLHRLGCSCDWDRTRFTLDEMCARAVRETFFKLFKDGLIYRGKRLVNWDVQLQTSISDDEIYHENVKTSLWHIRYPIVEGSSGRDTGFQPVQSASDVGEPPAWKDPGTTHGLETRVTPGAPGGSSADRVDMPSENSVDRPSSMVVATTRPETLLGDTAVAVNSQDPRWNWAIGKFVELPLTGRRIPIIKDDELVDPKFGTGVVKVTPAHDPNDYAVWQRHQGQADQIDLINLMNPDGTLNAAAGERYAGLTMAAARKKVVEDLTAAGLLVKEEPYDTQVGHSDRSKTPVQPYLSDQWFVKMAPLAEPALEVVRNGTIQFFPERHAQQYLSWLGEKRDWPISRQLWWGHRIPVWSKDIEVCWKKNTIRDKLLPTITNAEIVYGRDVENASVYLQSTTTGIIYRLTDFDGVRPELDGNYRVFICLRSQYVSGTSADREAILEEDGFVRDPDVLDTWFSSALWPHSTLGWPEQTPELARWYPTSVLLTGRDIITLWVARMVMTGLYNMGQVPFAHVAINPTILDGKGERMSKTKGNGVDPVDIIFSHGADALRFTLGTMATETQDVRMPVQVVCPHCAERMPNPDHKTSTMVCAKCDRPFTRPIANSTGTHEAPLARMTSDKFDFGRNFCNKLWNACRFAFSNLQGVAAERVEESRWSLADRWIVTRFNRTVAEADAALAVYRFDVYAKACYDFFWRDLCDWYLEAIKPAMKDAGRVGQTAEVLAAVLDGTLRLLHPIIPFITETIWWRLNDARPRRGLPGRLECPPSPRLIKAQWPIVGAFDGSAEHVFPRLQEIIGAIRTVRNERQIDPKRTVDVTIVCTLDEPTQVLLENRELIELLATCALQSVGDVPAPGDAVRVSAAGNDVYLEGLVNPAAEKERLLKDCQTLARQVATLRGRLGNEAYLGKAPPHLVQQTRDQLAQAETEFQKLGCATIVSGD